MSTAEQPKLEEGVWTTGPDGELIPDYESTFPTINEGEVVHGTVVRVDKDEVLVDIGYKSEGVIPVDEFLDDYRLYTYAVKAYGLEDMGYAKAFMRKVLESDLTDKLSAGLAGRPVDHQRCPARLHQRRGARPHAPLAGRGHLDRALSPGPHPPSAGARLLLLALRRQPAARHDDGHVTTTNRRLRARPTLAREAGGGRRGAAPRTGRGSRGRRLQARDQLAVEPRR